MAPRRQGAQPPTGSSGDAEPKVRYQRWLLFEAHLWGDPDPTGANALQDFSACIELEAELLTALYDNCGGTPNILTEAGDFDQPTNDARFGRLYVLRFAIGTSVTDLPNIVLPYSTATTSGVQVITTMVVDFPDGSSSTAGVIIAPPP